eukprot:9469744-Pyramimonas_sp.AAC.1
MPANSRFGLCVRSPPVQLFCFAADERSVALPAAEGVPLPPAGGIVLPPAASSALHCLLQG